MEIILSGSSLWKQHKEIFGANLFHFRGRGGQTCEGGRRRTYTGAKPPGTVQQQAKSAENTILSRKTISREDKITEIFKEIVFDEPNGPDLS